MTKPNGGTSRRLSPEWLAHINSPAFKAGQGALRDPEVRMKVRITRRRNAAGKAFAKRLVSDPEYVQNLQERLNKGKAGLVELYLLRMTYGDPVKDDAEEKAAVERFEAIRSEIREMLRSAPDESRHITALVANAPRLLPAPVLVQRPQRQDGEGPGSDG